MKAIMAGCLIGWMGSAGGIMVGNAFFPVDLIDAVIAAESTYRNITISGEFGTVTIIGDDAEAFLQSEYPALCRS